jgi:hypothetical protein
MESREPGSVSELLTRSRQGDEAAGQQLLLRLHKDFQGEFTQISGDYRVPTKRTLLTTCCIGFTGA